MFPEVIPVTILAVRTIQIPLLYVGRWIIRWASLSPCTTCTFEPKPFCLVYGVIFMSGLQDILLKTIFLQYLTLLCIMSFEKLTSRLFLICFMDIFYFDTNFPIRRWVWTFVILGRLPLIFLLKLLFLNSYLVENICSKNSSFTLKCLKL